MYKKATRGNFNFIPHLSVSLRVVYLLYISLASFRTPFEFRDVTILLLLQT